MNWVQALPLGHRWNQVKTTAQAAVKLEGSHVDEDVDLMLRLKAGDAEAFNRLMDKYQRTVVNLVYRFTGEATQAEDLAQEVFLRVYRAAPRYEPKAKFFTYLYQITLNLCRNEREKNQRRRTVSLDSSLKDSRPGWDVPDPEPSAEGQLQRQETAAQVQEAISSLSEDQKELLILQRFQNLGYEELAQMTRQTVSAVKAKLHRARQALKKRLQPILAERGEL
jgi:RNA polymerase sigma-70 factor (ECF subfamily)